VLCGVVLPDISKLTDTMVDLAEDSVDGHAHVILCGRHIVDL
jgi:hypothetical protein